MTVRGPPVWKPYRDREVAGAEGGPLADPRLRAPPFVIQVRTRVLSDKQHLSPKN